MLFGRIEGSQDVFASQKSIAMAQSKDTSMKVCPNSVLIPVVRVNFAVVYITTTEKSIRETK